MLFCSQTAQSGRPRAHGGQSRWQAVPPDPRRSVSGPWRLHMRDGFFRRIQDSPLKCRDSSRRSTSIFETAFFKKVSNLKTFLGNCLAFIDGVTAPCKNAVNRACGHLGGPLGISNFFCGGASGTPGASREGNKFRLGSFEPAVGRRTNRLHIYRVGGPRAPSHLVNMQSICSAADRGLEGAKTDLFPLPGGSSGARRGPRKKF